MKQLRLLALKKQEKCYVLFCLETETNPKKLVFFGFVFYYSQVRISVMKTFSFSITGALTFPSLSNMIVR